jgi:hypothetical protein
MANKQTFLVLLALVLLPAVALGWCVGGAPPARDPDNDGLNDIQEEFFLTDPNDPDSDDNGVGDGDEDNDGDSIVNQDEPTLFSLEFYEDIFTQGRYALILEGSNLFDAPRGVTRGRVVFPDVNRSVSTSLRRRRHHQTRIYLRFSAARARRLLGDDLAGDVRFFNADGPTNTLHPVDMHCQPGPPSLMGAAYVRFKIAPGNARRYVVIGGCYLLERDRRFARGLVHHASDVIRIRAPHESVATLQSRVFVPVESLAKPDPVFPPPAPILVGDTLQVETEAGMSASVMVEDIIADLRIPQGNLEGDHDADRLTSRAELDRVPPTDPLMYDTDDDGVHDGLESGPNSDTDPLDPDSDGDGIRDGDE